MRMKKLSYLIISLYLVLLVHCATEQKTTLPTAISQERYGAPIWNVGDMWRYRYTNKREWQYTVERIEGNLYIVEDRYGVDKPCFDRRNLELKFILTPQGKKVTSETVWYYGIYCDFPIYVGKKWGKMFSGRDTFGSQMDYLHEFKVISYEDTAVPAGTFKSFKIEFSKTIAARTSSVYRHYFWFSPEIKTIIKSSYAGKEGDWKPGSFDFELISFKLKDKQPPSPAQKLQPQGVDTTTKPQAPLTEKPPIVKPVAPSPVKNIVVVTGTSANIRSGAGNEFPTIAIVKQGDKLIFLGEYNEWFNVRLENGQEGWINRMFIKD
jgi:hypothetical protein